MEDGCLRQLWRLSLEMTKGPTWGTGTHVKLQLKGVLSLCFPHLETSTWAFTVLTHGLCCLRHNQRAETQQDQLLQTFPFKQRAHRLSQEGSEGGFTMSGMTLASKLELQADEQLPTTPITATHYQKLLTVSEKDNRKQTNWMFTFFPPLPPPQDCNKPTYYERKVPMNHLLQRCQPAWAKGLQYHFKLGSKKWGIRRGFCCLPGKLHLTQTTWAAANDSWAALSLLQTGTQFW